MFECFMKGTFALSTKSTFRTYGKTTESDLKHAFFNFNVHSITTGHLIRASNLQEIFHDKF